MALTLLGQNKAHFATGSTTGAFWHEHDSRPIFQLMLADFDLWNLQHHLDNLAEIKQIFNYQILLGIVAETNPTCAVTKPGELADGGYNVGDRETECSRMRSQIQGLPAFRYAWASQDRCH